MTERFASVCVLLAVTGAIITLANGDTIDEIIRQAFLPNSNRGTDIPQDAPGTDGEYKLVEYDVMIHREEFGRWLEGGSKRKRRKARRDSKYRWPSKTVPYELDDTFSSADTVQVKAAIAEWEQHTCLRFRPRSSDRSYIRFKDAQGCSSLVGYHSNAGVHPINLERGTCRHKRIIVHEVGHAIGFWHEQSRTDRDNFVRIRFENILDRNKHNFKKHSEADSMGVPYDYKSIMHYGKNFFTKNGLITIQTLDPHFQDVIGTVPGLSFRDIKLANLLYSCSGTCRNAPRCSDEGFLSKDCKCLCPGNPTKPCKPGCGGQLTGTSGSFSSPNYPQHYPTNTKCTWSIQADSGTINLTFPQFQINDCPYDYVDVYDGNSETSTRLGRFCGTNYNEVRSSGRNLLVVLVSDRMITDVGFTAVYQTATIVCNWGEWERWGSCSNSCGGGTKTRYRDQTSESQCSPPNQRQSQSCNKQPCQVCKWDSWEPWGSCSKSCGRGTQTGYRDRTAESTSNCSPRTERRTQSCNTVPCQVCEWRSWEPWSSCSETCEGGIQTSYRNRTPGSNSDTCSPRSERKTKLCNTHLCAAVQGRVVMCYFQSVARHNTGDGRFTEMDIDPDLCSHVIILGGNIHNGDLDVWIDPGVYENLRNVRETSDFKILLTLGHWGTPSTEFTAIMASRSSRQIFIQKVFDLVRKENLDGFEVFWQPNIQERNKYTLLLQEMRQAINSEVRQSGQEKLILTAMIFDTYHYDLRAVCRELDYLNVKTYDYAGWWSSQTAHYSPLYSRPGDHGLSVSNHIDRYVQAGADKGKIVLGIMSYGRTFRSNGTTTGSSALPRSGGDASMAYRQVCKRIRNDNWQYVYDRQRVAVYAYGEGTWVSYENKDTVTLKARYARQEKLAGAHLLFLSGDEFNNQCMGGRFTLLKAISSELNPPP